MTEDLEDLEDPEDVTAWDASATFDDQQCELEQPWANMEPKEASESESDDMYEVWPDDPELRTAE